MERTSAQESVSEPKVFEIPINFFEKYIKTESLKKKILNLFSNHNHLKSELELAEIYYKLKHACSVGDFKLIKILLGDTIKSNNLIFKIDKENKTASLFKVDSSSSDVFIPRTVEHEMNDYLITSIVDLDCLQIPSSYLRRLPRVITTRFPAGVRRKQSNVKIIRFDDDSAVSKIYGNAFSNTNIEEIYFPKSLIELGKGWYKGTEKLTKIIISPSNGQFIFKDDKYLLGKSDPNNDEFDVLLFARRDIDEISIPSNITKISDHAFYFCKELKKVSIPPSVTNICGHAFYSCKKLKKVSIPANSNLQTIGFYAFSYTNIEEIYFPNNLIVLGKGWCQGTEKLTKITISPSNGQFIFKDDKYLLGKSDPNNDEFDILLFARRDIDEISIPSNITIISDYAFSNLTIKEISIPSSVTKICDYAFSECKNLTKVSILDNSNLQTIGSNAFYSSGIKGISIPSSVTKIYENAFRFCKNLTKVSIPTNSNLQIIENYAFYFSGIKEISIPSSVTKICDYAFSECKNLTKVSILDNSNLQTIGSNAFYSSGIKGISIPPSVTKIYENAFRFCSNLTKVSIPTNSNLQIIESKAFSNSIIKGISIPPSVIKIYENAFDACFRVQIIEISEESKLQSIPKFEKHAKLIIMIPPSLNELIHTINII